MPSEATIIYIIDIQCLSSIYLFNISQGKVIKIADSYLIFTRNVLQIVFLDNIYNILRYELFVMRFA